MPHAPLHTHPPRVHTSPMMRAGSLTSLGLALLLAASASAEGEREAAAAAHVATPWELEDSDPREGWELYTAPVDGSDHLQYRLVSRNRETVQEVARAIHTKLRDVRYMKEGFDRKILATGDDYIVNYVRMDIPVVSDRDVVVETRWWTDGETSAYHVTWAPPEGPVPPVPDGVHRIESRGSWEVSPIAGGGSKVVYTSHSELGNSIPGWLVSRLMNDQIIDEYRTLNEILREGLPDVASPPPAIRPPATTAQIPAAASALID